MDDPSIRLLHLDRTDVQVDGKRMLRGSLRSMSLACPESFTAISYACGGQEETEYILIDGKRLGITRNCRDGLTYLRDEFGVRVIWVDAVCIAHDEADKRRQLPLMTDVYGKARTVYIWLGIRHPDGLSERGLDWFSEVSLIQSPLLGVRLAHFPKNMHYREIAKTVSILPRVLKAKLTRSPPKAIPRQDELDAIRDIIGRQYFTRVWCMQEAAMAERPVVVCGNCKIPWNSVVWGLIETWKQANPTVKAELWPTVQSVSITYSLWLEISRESEFRMSKHRMWIPKDWRIYKSWIFLLDYMEIYGLRVYYAQLTLVCAWITTRFLLGQRPLNSIPLAALVVFCAVTRLLIPPRTDMHWDRGLRRSFVNLLSSVRKQQTTDPKDKVYALYGLLQRLDIKLPQPDYTPENSLEQAYTSFTHSVIQWHHSLEILLEASGPWGSKAPSWVTDWRTLRKQLKLPLSGDNAVDFVKDAEPSPPYSFSKDLRELTVPAQRLGKLTFRVGDITPVLAVEEPTAKNCIYTIEALQAYRANIIVLQQWLSEVHAIFSSNSTDILSKFLSSIPIADLPASLDARNALFYNWIRILLGDRVTDQAPDGDADPSSSKDIRTPSKHARNLAQAIQTMLSPSSVPDKWSPLIALAKDNPTWHLHHSICSILSDQRATFFIARTAPLHQHAEYVLGWGPHACQVGDELFFLQTLKVPVVLRAALVRDGGDDRGGGFHFIGAAHAPVLSWDKLWGNEEDRETVRLV